MTRVAIRPPEYFPTLSYMALVVHVDLFVLADTFQYSHKSLHNRTRLRNPQGWQWITVPLRGTQHKRPIREVEISNRRKWARSHRRAFAFNYRSTMYFEYYEEDFMPLLETTWERLGPLTTRSVELLSELLEIDTPLRRASELPSAPGSVPAVLDALEEYDDVQLVAPPAAAEHDAAHAPAVSAFYYDEPTYRQNFEGFEPGMSTADMLFNYGPETRALLREEARAEPVDA